MMIETTNMVMELSKKWCGLKTYVASKKHEATVTGKIQSWLREKNLDLRLYEQQTSIFFVLL